ncbi:UNVERIFIED_CONTAM: hypothetical protein K2H54_015327 [Gekko kuhli]
MIGLEPYLDVELNVITLEISVWSPVDDSFFDDGDERTLRRTSLCLKGERHFAESETLDQLPLTNPEHFGTPVIGKKSNRGRRSSLPVNEDEKEEESSEEEDDDKRRLNDELLGKVVSVTSSPEKTDGYPALIHESFEWMASLEFSNLRSQQGLPGYELSESKLPSSRAVLLQTNTATL